ncbi:hypothetical protein KY386_02640 [Candidatus Parcubacteria bacterium]|nr:hypothetical protein [Candidatus Parcubacteria bacterium]
MTVTTELLQTTEDVAWKAIGELNSLGLDRDEFFGVRRLLTSAKPRDKKRGLDWIETRRKLLELQPLAAAAYKRLNYLGLTEDQSLGIRAQLKSDDPEQVEGGLVQVERAEAELRDRQADEVPEQQEPLPRVDGHLVEQQLRAMGFANTPFPASHRGKGKGSRRHRR